jgi:hypothetical protein
MQAKVYAVEPAKVTAGQVVEAKLYGANLDTVTAVQVSGSGIRAELLETGPSELRVRLSADPGLEQGSRLITIQAGTSKTTVAFDVSPSSPATAKAAAAAAAILRSGNRPGIGDAAEASPDEPLRSADTKGSISPTTESGVDRRARRSGGATGKSAASAGLRQRGDLRLPVGGCTGFRLTSGSEQSCGGSADFEVSSRGERSELVMEAPDGLRNLGGVSLDEAERASGESLSSSTALVAGNTYLVKGRHGLAVVRVIQIRGIESVRNAPPAALRGPRIGGPDREIQGSSANSELTLLLEWKILQQ